MQNLLVTIIIPNYNYGKFLPTAIESVLEQRGVPIEVIVVDDGSTDCSRAVIESYKRYITPVFKPNGGLASAFNAGFAASGGDVVCFLDADDFYLPGKIQRVVEIFRTYPFVDWVFHALQVQTDEGIRVWQTPPFFSKVVDFRRHMRWGWSIPPAGPTSGLCFRRQVLACILPMPEIRGSSLDDNFIKASASYLGTGYYLDEALAVQVLHGGNMYTNNPERISRLAQRQILAAYWLRQRYTAMRLYTHRLLAKGLAFMRQSGMTWSDDDNRIIRAYLAETPFVERLWITLLSGAYYLWREPWQPGRRFRRHD